VSTTPLDFYSTGKRKTSIARVHLRPGTGEFQLNTHGLDEFFGGIEALKQIVKQPFSVTETNDKFDVLASVHGGGVSGQAGAIRHGISKALCVWNAEMRARLKKAGFLTRDARIKERKKYGQKGARRRFQFSKR
jgi:small subunit ribosomal protein S9